MRDFVDVRDVVRAYYRLLLDGKAGEVYNICGEKGVSLAEVVDRIADIVGVSVTTRVNPDFVRPGDNQVVIGSAEKNPTGYRLDSGDPTASDAYGYDRTHVCIERCRRIRWKNTTG